MIAKTLMGTFNKIVQIPIDAELLSALDELARTGAEARSALIRRACTEYLRRLREEELDRAYEEGYRRIPEDSSVGDAQVAMARDILPKESW
jgi:metal-responsive CopG/Arc/MetJ family transcriptional regulator